MLSPQLRKKVDNLWSLFWSAGMTNPLVAIGQLTYLRFRWRLGRLASLVANGSDPVRQVTSGLNVACFVLTPNEIDTRQPHPPPSKPAHAAS